MKRTNLVPKSSGCQGECSDNPTPIKNTLNILEPQLPYLNNDVINGFIHMFEDNDNYLKHLNRLRTFRNFASDLLEQNPSLHDKLFPLFDTCNRIAGILLLNSKVSDELPDNSYYINRSK